MKSALCPIEIVALLQDLRQSMEDVRRQLSGKRKRFYTISEFADLTGRSEYTARRWVSEGRISAIRVKGTGPRGKLFIPAEQLEQLVAHGLGENVPEIVVGD